MSYHVWADSASGPGGIVHMVPLPGEAMTRGCIAQWLLDAPGAHPHWRYHVLTVVHLRPLEGIPEASVQFPGASHEMQVLALDPTKDDVVDSADWSTMTHWMTPPDVVVQFIVGDDADARKVARLAAHAVAQGRLVPDSDYRTHWEQTIQATSEHVRLGEHPDSGEAAGTDQDHRHRA